jgi:hypothetical protein
MRSTYLLVAGAVVAAITACSSGSKLKVRTTTEPGVNLTALHTFYVLRPPTRSANARPLSANDPMLDNSITNNELRSDLAQAFQSRGYVAVAPQNADFQVAYFAGTKEKFDTTYWGPTYAPGWRYSYYGGRGWAWPYYGPGYFNGPYYYDGGASINEYTQGQVIVDVTDPRTKELLWRGQGVEPVSNDPAKYNSQLEGVVNAIVAKFPQATARMATGR